MAQKKKSTAARKNSVVEVLGTAQMRGTRMREKYVLFAEVCTCIDWEVGVIIPNGNISYADTIAYETSAAALEIGREELNRQQLLNNFTFRFTFTSGNCSDIGSAGAAAELIKTNKVAAIIGPPCNLAARAVAPLSTYYNIATFAWGLATASEVGRTVYSSIMTITTTGRQ
ncbi:hypothetical protein ANCDUO_00265 [Ancylostoma duodenale]|uniref:Receptor ligand binding region domain-containing protein n=1 Tax=Ancylostoma duodenale TaxID=51022 RepID=A0A0C2HII7_9BILA|nr:hypothetical protein ANCDUO_00265 [Ancylostoma duodenale]